MTKTINRQETIPVSYRGEHDWLERHYRFVSESEQDRRENAREENENGDQDN